MRAPGGTGGYRSPASPRIALCRILGAPTLADALLWTVRPKPMAPYRSVHADARSDAFDYSNQGAVRFGSAMLARVAWPTTGLRLSFGRQPFTLGTGMLLTAGRATAILGRRRVGATQVWGNSLLARLGYGEWTGTPSCRARRGAEPSPIRACRAWHSNGRGRPSQGGTGLDDRAALAGIYRAIWRR